MKDSTLRGFCADQHSKKLPLPQFSPLKKWQLTNKVVLEWLPVTSLSFVSWRKLIKTLLQARKTTQGLYYKTTRGLYYLKHKNQQLCYWSMPSTTVVLNLWDAIHNWVAMLRWVGRQGSHLNLNVIGYFILTRYWRCRCSGRAVWGADLDRSCTGSRVRIPLKAWMCVLVFLYCVVLCR
jgi:hypothetical protein